MILSHLKSPLATRQKTYFSYLVCMWGLACRRLWGLEGQNNKEGVGLAFKKDEWQQSPFTRGFTHQCHLIERFIWPYPNMQSNAKQLVEWLLVQATAFVIKYCVITKLGYTKPYYCI